MNSMTFMKIAKLIAENSKCVSVKVGAVIEKDGRIISTGYNGTPVGHCNCCDVAKHKGWVNERGILVDRPAHSEWSARNEVHAEINAILFAARNGIATQGASIWCTHSPCPDCCKAIANSGIAKLYFMNKYDRGASDWESILDTSGVKVYHVG